MTKKPKSIQRGRFIPLPGRAGSIKIDRDGSVLYKAPAKRKNPSTRKAKKQLKRGMKKMAAWVRQQLPAKKARKR